MGCSYIYTQILIFHLQTNDRRVSLPSPHMNYPPAAPLPTYPCLREAQCASYMHASIRGVQSYESALPGTMSSRSYVWVRPPERCRYLICQILSIEFRLGQHQYRLPRYFRGTHWQYSATRQAFSVSTAFGSVSTAWSPMSMIRTWKMRPSLVACVGRRLSRKWKGSGL